MAGLYQYTPLTDQHIRLLTLLPGSFDDEVHLHLTPVELQEDQPPDYHALSYAWGSTERYDTVYVETSEGQRPLPVTWNLHSALKNLRHTTEIRTIWADAICINQDNVVERNEQVAMMASIYQMAFKVVIWLGPEADGSTEVIRTLDSIGSSISVDWTLSIITNASIERADPNWLDPDEPAPFDDSTWIPLGYLLSRPWFERLWIWQEVLLARRAEILCGHESMSWECFRRATLLIARKPKPGSVIRSLNRACSISTLGKTESLQRVMQVTKEAQCSDPRDRIYAILYLVVESERLGIRPDYTKTTMEVFRDLMIRSLDKNDALNLLPECELSEEPTQLPSWVPNWDRPRKTTDILMANACWNSRPHARYNDGDRLMVLGCHAATVRRVVPIVDDISPLDEDTIHEILYAALRRILSAIRDDGSINLGQEAEAVCRTLTCDIFANRWEPMRTEGLDFQKTMKLLHATIDNTTKASEYLLVDFRRFLGDFRSSCFGRVFVFTEEGYIGLAPERCQPHDIIVIVLGCQSPMVLRPTNTGEYRVVGESYMHDMMSGEIFLGPLAKNWQRCLRYAEDDEQWWTAFIDREKGIWQARDPRLGPLPEGWAEVEHPKQHLCAVFHNELEDLYTWFDPRMLPSSLHDSGVILEEFNLV